MSTVESRCETCGHITRTYTRMFPKAEIRPLFKLYVRSKPLGRTWVHIRDLQGKAGGGDFAKLRYWGLIEEAANNSPKKKNCGYWRITQDGRYFMQGTTRIRSHAVIVDGECIGFDGDNVGISDVWIRAGFDIRELMRLKIESFTLEG